MPPRIMAPRTLHHEHAPCTLHHAPCTDMDLETDFDVTCPYCGEALDADLFDGRGEPDDRFAHILLPARRWWDDIVFT